MHSIVDETQKKRETEKWEEEALTARLDDASLDGAGGANPKTVHARYFSCHAHQLISQSSLLVSLTEVKQR